MKEKNMEELLKSISERIKENESLEPAYESDNISDNISLDIAKEEREKSIDAYKKLNNSFLLENVLEEIKENPDAVVISTGFKKLDNALKGGLRESLYLLGAAPSMGKTTLAMQIADNIANAGRDVIVFSLEMSNRQLIRKSLSRIMLETCLNKNIDLGIAKDSIEIIDLISNKSDAKEKEKEVLEEAIEKYKKIGEHLHVIEARGAAGVSSIRKAVKKHKDLTGNAPVVFIDYLQILAPPERNFNEKQNIDKTMTELKRISAEFSCPVVAVSSFNRDNYDKDANMKAWKESGSAEYGADNMIVLQFKGTGSKDFNMDKLKEKEIRETELKIVKGRELEVGTKIEQKYYAKYNYFYEE